MATATSFKNYNRGTRSMATEIGFAKGMQYTDSFIDEGYAKLLVNYDLDSAGTIIKPRGGMKKLSSNSHTTNDTNTSSPAYWRSTPDVTFTGMLYVGAGVNYGDPILRHVTFTQSIVLDVDSSLFGTDYIAAQKAYTYGSDMFDYGGDTVWVEYNGTLLMAGRATTAVTRAYLTATGRTSTDFDNYEQYYTKITPINSELLAMHGMPVVGASPGGLNTVLDNNLYMIGGDSSEMLNNKYDGWYKDKRIKLMRLEVWESGTYTTGADGKQYPVFRYAPIPVKPKDVLPSQAINYGYNMAKPAPYTFSSHFNDTGVLDLEGIIPYDSDGKLALTAKVGDMLTFHLIANISNTIVNANGGFRVQWEITDLQSDSEPMILQTVRQGGAVYLGSDTTISFKPSYKQFAITVKVYGNNAVNSLAYTSQTDDMAKLTPLKVMTLASYRLTSDTESAGADLKTYALATATGMCTWKQRLVLWGIQNAETAIFTSELNDPSWFPYPNGYDQFDGQVLKCVPYLDALLVFTNTKLYSLTFDLTGLGYTSKCIQNNLNMTQADSYAIQIVKNMVYFKSGNYFYMVVPKASSLTGELQIAPISKPIERLLDTFSTNIPALLDNMYDFKKMYDLDTRPTELIYGPSNMLMLNGVDSHFQESYAMRLKDYYTYVEGSMVNNVYKMKIDVARGWNVDWVLNPGLVVDPATGKYKYTLSSMPHAEQYIDFILRYDTVLRTWSTHIRNSTMARIVPYLNSATDGAVYCSVFRTYASVPPYKGQKNYQWTWQFVTLTDSSDSCVDTIPNSSNYLATIKNTQFLDTGYRKLNEQLKKRFREIQFFVNNLSQSILRFNTEVMIDDDTRKPMFHYTVTQITDPADPNYGALIVDKEADEIIQNVTTLADNTVDTDTSWYLDFSKFPEINTVKVRVKTSGKGYGIRFKLFTESEAMYELTTMNWVYRTMNAR